MPDGVVAGALYGAPLRRRKRVLILEPEPAIASFFADVELRLKAGTAARVEREAEELALLGFGDLVDDEEALLGLPR